VSLRRLGQSVISRPAAVVQAVSLPLAALPPLRAPHLLDPVRERARALPFSLRTEEAPSLRSTRAEQASLVSRGTRSEPPAWALLECDG
jgi:hypothetical protein